MKYFLLSIGLFISAIAFSQKLPDQQNRSIYRVNAVKIDGKALEWKLPLEADNKKTLLQYTAAHDERYLYFVLKTDNVSNMNKIVNGGLSISLNLDGKKRLKDAYAISYPLRSVSSSTMGMGRSTEMRSGNSSVVVSSVVTVSSSGGGSSGGGAGRGGAAQGRSAGSGRGAAGTNSSNAMLDQANKRRDSLTRLSYKRILDKAKEIKIEGFKSVQDSTLSIYNEHGLKVAMAFDQSGHLVYEIAIPLKMMGIEKLNKQEIMYQIRINPIFNTSSIMIGGGFSDVDLFSASEFWAKYTLDLKANGTD